MATIIKRGEGQWQAKIRKKGYPTETNTFSNKAKAEKWARQVESEMDRGLFQSASEAESTSLNELFERYKKDILPTKKSIAQELSRMKIISLSLGEYKIAALTPKVLSEYRDQRLQSVSNSTTRKDLLLISRVLNDAQKQWGIYLPLGNPISRISLPKHNKGRERRLSQQEEALIFDVSGQYGLNGQMKAIITIAIETGMRRGEICKLQWQYIDLEYKTAKILDTKNGEDREIPLSQIAINTLKSLKGGSSGYVFAMLEGSITQAFERICKSQKIEDLRFHDLRHEATSRFFEKGLNIMEVSTITGHKDLSMLKRYTHLKAKNLAQKLSNL